jgi:hypothetical protein
MVMRRGFKAAPEGSCGNTAMQMQPARFILVRVLARDQQDVLLLCDRQIILGQAGRRHADAQSSPVFLTMS